MSAIQSLFASGRVQRFHSNPTMARHGQTNADHQWGCLALLLALHPDPGTGLIRAVAFHDVDELCGGDLSFDFKRRHPKFTREHERLSREMAVEAGLPESNQTDPWVGLVDRLESFLYMRMHGQEWDPHHVNALLAKAEELNVKTKVQEIING